MFSIPSISSKLKVNEEGIWVPVEIGTVSYPQEGHESFYLLEDKSYWFNHRNNCIKEVMKNFPPPENTVVDIGSGNGFVSSFLKSIGICAICVEPGSQGIKNSRKRGLENLIQADFKTGLFLSSTVPAIGIFDVLEHVRDETGFLSALHDCIAKNGRLYLTVPSYNLLWSNEDTQAGHFRRYTNRRLCKAVTAAGFSLEYITCMFTFLPLPIFIFRTLPSRLWPRSATTGTRTDGDYGVKNKQLEFMLSLLLKHEVNATRRNKNLLLGSSILAVVKKT